MVCAIHEGVLFLKLYDSSHVNTGGSPGGGRLKIPYTGVGVAMYYSLTDWMSLLWHLTNCRWNYSGCVCKCLYSKKYSLQYTMHIIELVWIFVQQPRNEVTVTRVSLVLMQLSVMRATSEVIVIVLWCCGLWLPEDWDRLNVLVHVMTACRLVSAPARVPVLILKTLSLFVSQACFSIYQSQLICV